MGEIVDFPGCECGLSAERRDELEERMAEMTLRIVDCKMRLQDLRSERARIADLLGIPGYSSGDYDSDEVK